MGGWRYVLNLKHELVMHKKTIVIVIIFGALILLAYSGIQGDYQNPRENQHF